MIAITAAAWARFQPLPYAFSGRIGWGVSARAEQVPPLPHGQVFTPVGIEPGLDLGLHLFRAQFAHGDMLASVHKPHSIDQSSMMRS